MTFLKKVWPLALALVLVLGLAVGASADEAPWTPTGEPVASMEIGGIRTDFFADGTMGHWNEKKDAWEKKTWEGLSYDHTTNTLTLDGVQLPGLAISYEPEEGEKNLPNADLTIQINGSSLIEDVFRPALTLSSGVHATIRENGQSTLDLMVENGPNKMDNEGHNECHAVVVLQDDAALIVDGPRVNLHNERGCYSWGLTEEEQAHNADPANAEDQIEAHKLEVMPVGICGTFGEETVKPSTLQIKSGGITSFADWMFSGVEHVIVDGGETNGYSFYLADGMEYTQNGGSVTLMPVDPLNLEPGSEMKLQGGVFDLTGSIWSGADITIGGEAQMVVRDEIMPETPVDLRGDALGLYDGTLTIRDGELNVEGRIGICLYHDAELRMTGGKAEVEGRNVGLENNGGKVQLDGGSFHARSTATEPVQYVEDDMDYRSFGALITFEVTEEETKSVEHIGTLTITGGNHSFLAPLVEPSKATSTCVGIMSDVGVTEINGGTVHAMGGWNAVYGACGDTEKENVLTTLSLGDTMEAHSAAGNLVRCQELDHYEVRESQDGKDVTVFFRENFFNEENETPEIKGNEDDQYIEDYGTLVTDLTIGEKTGEPDEPDTPDVPDQPDQPDQSERPYVPVTPVKPAKSAESVPFPFTDVQKSDWYYDSVRMAWEKNLIDGMTATTFDPNGTLTVAQTVKLAAALHQMDHLGKVTLENGTDNWYSTYVQYAIANGIIDEGYADRTVNQMNQAITRSEFVKIFHGALGGYTRKNQVADNAIPDVRTGDENAAEIYDFYRAGILIGSDEAGHFNPASQIKRSEAAAILIRMFDQSVRQTVTLP